MDRPVSIAPLVTFRMAFGLVMLFSTIRYLSKGWVHTQLVAPKVHFSYYGFEWVKPLPGTGMYWVFSIMILACIGITLGWYYRLFASLFFLCFTYVELIDITYYLNHYYFVSMVALLMVFVPANRYFSLDLLRDPSIRQEKVRRWQVGIFKLQIGIVYCYAGLAKINYDWLVNALPLSIWLPAKTGVPVIGFLFDYKMTAYAFSWLGMLFDALIIGGLLWKRTRWLAYIAVVVFHSLTGMLFQIGVFPLVMILGVTIFFSDEFHKRLINCFSYFFQLVSNKKKLIPTQKSVNIGKTSTIARIFLITFCAIQLLFPWRYLLYKGNVFWTEEGYRFAWRVMLMEKAGTATFYVKDGPDGREGSVINHQFLNDHQEKQMAMQPDMILQFAHYLDDYYKLQGMVEPEVRAEVWVTLNARPAKLLIDPKVDLTTLKDSWKTKTWIQPFDEPKIK